jgi:transcriptional regulator GlxA family with amidase domain
MDTPAPTKYAIALYQGFQALDAFGPLDILNLLSLNAGLNLSLHVLAPQKGPVSTLAPGLTIGQHVVATHSFADIPSDIEVLLVPGGLGTRNIEATQPVVDLLRAVFPKLRHLLTICTGSALAARAGLLARKRATSNKLALDWVKTQDASNSVYWEPHARWVKDGKIWTASGISAGIDMMYAFVAAQYGEHVAANIAITAEYTRNKDPDVDAFAI